MVELSNGPCGTHPTEGRQMRHTSAVRLTIRSLTSGLYLGLIASLSHHLRDRIRTGTDTDYEAGAPKVIHRNRKTSGSVGDVWVGYVRRVWVTTVRLQLLVKEQVLLFLVVRLQVTEGHDEEGHGDSRERSDLQTTCRSSQS
jgi:hypothetical protein